MDNEKVLIIAGPAYSGKTHLVNGIAAIYGGTVYTVNYNELASAISNHNDRYDNRIQPLRLLIVEECPDAKSIIEMIWYVKQNQPDTKMICTIQDVNVTIPYNYCHIVKLPGW